jgi:glutamate dehydrogenase
VQWPFAPFYQTNKDGQPKPLILVKFESRFAELPLPLYEIFVYSPRVEGVHTRWKVARGGVLVRSAEFPHRDPHR